jgi:hypothetical protein
MQINKIGIKATIATGQYQNIQPEIEISGCSIEEGIAVGMGHIKDMFSKYSEKGPLSEKDTVQVTTTLKSFNEEAEVQFEPIAHTYHYKGKKLVSATEHKAKFYKEFDTENVSAAASKSWGVDQGEIKDLWEANGKLTADFGTIVHKTLEHYTRFVYLGDKVSKAKQQKENYALPKHPILRSIIEGFIAIDQSVGEIIPEALITNVEKGFCGQSDRVVVLDKKNKVCDIEDYKININSEEISKDKKALAPFNELPANKLTEYQIQMSVYANMMQDSGWTVNKLVVYVYENEWKRYELPVLKVI